VLIATLPFIWGEALSTPASFWPSHQVPSHRALAMRCGIACCQIGRQHRRARPAFGSGDCDGGRGHPAGRNRRTARGHGLGPCVGRHRGWVDGTQVATKACVGQKARLYAPGGLLGCRIKTKKAVFGPVSLLGSVPAKEKRYEIA